jgi:hypothetical protein
VRLIEEQFGAASLHFLHHEELIADPQGELRRVCAFLGVEAFEDYLRDCTGILKKSPHQSRKSVEWRDYQVAAVIQGMKDCPWLSGYSFSS